MWGPGPLAFLVLGILALLAGLLSLREGWTFARKAGESLGGGRSDRPQAAVLAPLRGADPGLAGNLAALLSQDYPSYRVIFAVDSPDDPALPVIRAAATAAAAGRVPSTVVESPGPQQGGSGKSAALARAAADLRPGDLVVVTFDADSRPHASWLATLVAGLVPGVGVTTTYRWYSAVGGFWTALRSGWNASGFSLLFDDRYNFAWGGSLAMERGLFDRLRIRERWPAWISDDLVVTRAVKEEARLRVAFLPRALCVTEEPCDRRQCVEWTTRQAGMVYAYYPQITSFALGVWSVFCGIIALGIVGLILAVLAAPEYIVGAGLMLLDVPITALKAEWRRGTLATLVPEWGQVLGSSVGSYLLASLAVPWLMLVNLAKVRRLRSITWRGRDYPMPRPLARAPPEGGSATPEAGTQR